MRKVEMLLKFGARVTVVGPMLSPELLELGEKGAIECLERIYEKRDLDRVALVFACTDNHAVNEQVKKEASRKRLPVNVADSPGICDFIVPSIVKKGDITIAISTSGELPLLSKKLREKIEEAVGDDYLAYLRVIGTVRGHLMRTVKDPRARSAIMKRIDRMTVEDVITKGVTKIKEELNLP